MELEALKRQGKRTDLTSSPVGTKLRSDKELANSAGESKTQIHRYIRLTYLIPPLLDLVDSGRIALHPAEALSYLKINEQQDLYQTITIEDATPSLKQANEMKEHSAAGTLTPDVILSIMVQKKPNQKDKITFRVDRLRPYLPKGIPQSHVEQYILKALEYGVLYCVLKDKDATDGMVDLMVRADDAAKINRIFERIHAANINMTDLQTEIQQEQQNEERPQPEQTQVVEKEDAFLDLLMAKTPNTEGPELENPTMGQMPKSHPSVTTSEISSDFEKDIEHRPSVRELMKKIRKDLEAGRTVKRREPAVPTQTQEVTPTHKPIIKFEKEK